MVLTHGSAFVALMVTVVGVAETPNAMPVREQSPSGIAAFEVASVKISSAGNFAISPYGQGRFSIRSASLTLLLSLAYNVSDAQISGGPSWRDSEYYDVTAKPEDGVPLTYDELRPRLQELLAQRFKLATHREVRQSPGYALVVAKGGPNLKIANRESSTLGSILPGGLRAPGISMDSFAAMLARPVNRPVVNQTGLAGTYEIAVDYAPEAVADSSLPSIFTALQEQLGLKLDARTIPVEMIVIDHVEHPTEN